MTQKYILAIDQGTTGSRAIFYNSRGRPVAASYREFRQYYPQPGWVEHEPCEIMQSVKFVIAEALKKGNISRNQIEAIGITNQRETVVLWDRKSGRPEGRAVVWQDRRTEALCKKFRQGKWGPYVRQKTGLFFDP